jgi:hypothetical protein
MKTTHRIAAASLLLFGRRNSGPANTVLPSISSETFVIDTEITGVAGEWTGSPTITRQWYWSLTETNSGGTAITGATALNYTPVTGDSVFGKYLYFVEIPNGDTDAAIASAAVGPVKFASWALTAYWDLQEASGTRNDSYGANHLTDNNTVTQAVGPIGTDNAGNFVRTNNEYLSKASAAALQTGDIDFTVGGWFYLASDVNELLIGKTSADAANGYEYALYRFASDDKVGFIIGSDTTIQTLKSTLTASLSGWHFILAWQDVAANKIYIQVDGGTPAEATRTLTPTTRAFDFGIGGTAGNTGRLDGRAAYALLAKHVLNSTERGGGAAPPRPYASIAAAVANP